MAAPNTAYKNNGADKITLLNYGTVQVDHQPAVDGYGAIGNIKDLFYLDGVLWFQKDGVKWFIGFVYDDVNSFNYKHHASARKGAAALQLNSANIIAFLDAGLNTLGDAAQPGAQTDTSIRAKISALVWKTAYYVDSDELGYIIKKNTTTPNYSIDPFFIVQSNVAMNTNPSASNVVIGNAECWANLYIWAYNKNAEGVFINQTYRTVFLYGDPITLAYQTTQPTSSGDVTGIDNTYYTDADTTNGFPGSRISSDQTGFVAVTDGYYVSRTKERWYQVTGGYIVNQGTYTSAPPGYSYYTFYTIDSLSCGATNGAATILTLSSPPNISTGAVAPDGLGEGYWKNQDGTKVFQVYQSLECPGGGLMCADADKIIVYRIGTVTNC